MEYRIWQTSGLRRGSALVTVLCVAMALVALGSTLITLSVHAMRRSTHRADVAMASSLAETGLRHGFNLLLQDSSYPGQGNTWFPGGQFRVERSESAAPGLVTLTGIGRVRSLEGGYLERRVMGTVSMTGADPAWTFAVFTKGNQTYSSNFQAGSSDAPGPIHANGSIGFSGDSILYGKATAAGDITWSGNPTFHNGYKTGVSTKPFPTVDVAALRSEAAGNGIHTGDLSFSGDTEIHLSGKINGNLSISGNPRIVLDGPVWVTGEINISGNAVLGNGLLMGDGRIIISGSGGTTAEPDALPENNLALVGLGTGNDAVTINGSPGITGGIYAPDGGVTIDGNPPILGSILADRLYSSGEGRVNVNESYQPPPAFADRPKMVSWQED
jgi:hypothetical protein